MDLSWGPRSLGAAVLLVVVLLGVDMLASITLFSASHIADGADEVLTISTLGEMFAMVVEVCALAAVVAAFSLNWLRQRSGSSTRSVFAKAAALGAIPTFAISAGVYGDWFFMPTVTFLVHMLTLNAVHKMRHSFA